MDEVGSSPGSLSSPPHSPEQGNANSSSATRVLSSGGGGGVAGNTSSPTPASTAPAPRLTAAGTVRKKPGPKPKPKDPNAPEKKPRKPRKTAELKDPATEPVVRKRRTKASLEAQASPIAIKDEPVQHQPQPPPPPPPPQQQSLHQHFAPTPPPPRPSDFAAGRSSESAVQAIQSVQPVQPVAVQSARVLSNPEPLHNNPNLSHINTAPSTPRPASSGQRYDPIRGGLFESKPQSSSSVPPPVSPPMNRASASPSITSLIDPPSVSHSHYAQAPRLQQHPSVTSAPASPAAPPRPGPLLPHVDQQQNLSPQAQHRSPQATLARPSAGVGESTPMDVDSDSASKVYSAVPMKKSESGTGTPSNSNAPTPPVKPVRQKEAPPPLPTGSGLLSGTPFGPVNNGSNGSTDAQGVNIWLTFPLRGQNNVTINFAQEVEKKYGFAALHPKIAARKERLRQVTAAGAALEKAAGAGSNDDMSLDLSEPESNVDMGGMDDEGSAAGNGVKRRRKRKQEDYDKEDDFIDDTELAWEQSALMAKDGFFVYSGPLVTEGDKPAVERADGTVRRGRGRGRGGTVRGEASGRGRGRGGGPGSRGGNISRKPRVTKAERALMEQEKLEREKMGAAMAAKQPLGQASASAL
ncbi:HPC2-domain-containing protein [Aaosphaeria arxii CBS 175.79]|uniref:HPC2-domain-containing protein n=1 Tax=Aaosphaeria arxii CBS 175.79 TaxID=1450172 RepID=A0A6A5XFY4_9PLEO|nr:HPC2-domain-containing protein [Aaosphaeria arxii CBS 175.79]KAF2011756.1 HPC2-domain-containing protein [Aaosphaeria arxii CBS 175.79]